MGGDGIVVMVSDEYVQSFNSDEYVQSFNMGSD